MGRFAIMSLTEAAAGRVREIVETRGGVEGAGLRIGVKRGGCAGMEYTIEFADCPVAGEDVVEKDGARVFISPEAVLFLLGTVMDFEVSVLRTGFVFNNPNQTSACGCGESVELQPADRSRLEQAEA
ncbi:Fe-S cluster assembly scaffold SufA [Aureimonas altamirensis]|uniref:Fe-S cluster assembly scaffold SufA n=1 Tax=Aureimonas altamirensis TaxID=370622 RepID=UPI0020368352|nr:Fe-S cluster assembly scaffold SufA [Aureimonas altamirensis]MCM2502941.1 Fe-S cluster assembly scaffold SufA [Aureimonas altamirensis]